MRLSDLGDRICIIGQSGAGKSTLAAAIGRRTGLPVVHLDQYRHVPGSQWQLRSDDEFAELHDAAIRSERWVIEGNYSKLMPQRLKRATGLIVLDISTAASLARYVRRTLRPASRRIGGLDGTRDRLSWAMIEYILTGGAVTICPGTTVDLNDQRTGAPLSLDHQQRVIDFFSWKCAHPYAGPKGSTAPAGRTVTPMKYINRVGDLSADLLISPGNLEWWTTASSMTTGTYRHLYCESRMSYGTWADCGDADGSGSSLRTRLNQICPQKGQHFEVEAFLAVGGSDYFDTAEGTTQ
ncbi:hypothetical protein [Leifsonia sp. C5G2]|uniref:hypothetical protein n=1 Tax=Leifsonia sp. C5G2 TaxID=2735269 RepID=UPI0015857B86|nr:hypothetical protein [Leifsonia sp. C5G2]NUU05146.1 hypothetical protein [Leifsonia sp. C5G2]